LMIDYVLNVAVGISAGVGAIVSAAPRLQSQVRWRMLTPGALASHAGMSVLLPDGRESVLIPE